LGALAFIYVGIAKLNPYLSSQVSPSTLEIAKLFPQLPILVQFHPYADVAKLFPQFLILVLFRPYADVALYVWQLQSAKLSGDYSFG